VRAYMVKAGDYEVDIPAIYSVFSGKFQRAPR
jgi:hypothetical protein